jgi:hypothetical protein
MAFSMRLMLLGPHSVSIEQAEYRWNHVKASFAKSLGGANT